jgi:hypothetical protein
MAHFVSVCVPRQSDPAFVEIGRFDANTGFDQHRSCFNIRCFDRHTVIGRPYAGEHLAAHLPRIMATAPRVRDLGTRKGFTDGIDDLSAHTSSVTLCLRVLKGWRTRILVLSDPYEPEHLHYYLLHYLLNFSRAGFFHFHC